MIGFTSDFDIKLVKIYLLAMVFLIMSCDPSDEKLKVRNNADFPILCLYSFDETLSFNDSTVVEPYSGIGIKTNEVYSLRGYLLNWETAINSNSTEKKLSVYIFSEDSVKKYSWKDLVEAKKYNKVYILTASELRNMGWIIQYP
ncbi:MAG: hypothetical protein IPK10_14245 [Bacteroidetes bacterium]|nr:hypothetical protein [Bacteroidota bacterium]